MNGNGEAPPVFAIGMACRDMMHSATAFDFATLTRYGVPDHLIGLARGQSSIVAHARNNLVRAAKSMNATWLLFIDSDMTFPRDAAARLLAHGKDIVGCAYKRRTPPYDTMGQPIEDEKVELAEGLHEMRALGFGMILVKMSVFDRLVKPWFRHPFAEGDEDAEGEDRDFCNRAREVGYQIWCDVQLSQDIGHIGQVTFTEHGITEIRELRRQLDAERAAA